MDSHDSINEITVQQMMELDSAVEEGDLQRVKELCEQDIDSGSDGEEEFRNNLLVTASRKGYLEIVAFLLERGADVCYQDSSYGQSPLHGSARFCHKEVAHLLLKHGADVDAKENDGCTPFLNSIISYKKDDPESIERQRNAEMIDLLLNAGADINAVDEDGDSAIHRLSAELDLLKMHQIMADYERGEKRLNSEYDTGRETELAPLRQDVLNMVKDLINRGANVNLGNARGVIPLHNAAMCGWTDMATLLIQNNADVNAIGEDELRPIDFSTTSGYRDMTALLLEAGSQPAITKERSSVPAPVNELGDEEELRRMGIDPSIPFEVTPIMLAFKSMLLDAEDDGTKVGALLNIRKEVEKAQQQKNAPPPSVPIVQPVTRPVEQTSPPITPPLSNPYEIPTAPEPTESVSRSTKKNGAKTQYPILGLLIGAGAGLILVGPITGLIGGAALGAIVGLIIKFVLPPVKR